MRRGMGPRDRSGVHSCWRPSHLRVILPLLVGVCQEGKGTVNCGYQILINRWEENTWLWNSFPYIWLITEPKQSSFASSVGWPGEQASSPRPGHPWLSLKHRKPLHQLCLIVFRPCPPLWSNWETWEEDFQIQVSLSFSVSTALDFSYPCEW